MNENDYLTVTALTKYIKYKFDHDSHLKKILLRGEISNFKHHSRGHMYFTLKDDSSSISAIMFKTNASKLNFKPIEGKSVLVEGYISVYEASGTYQIYVSSMEDSGIGDLYKQYEILKTKLKDKGYFDTKYKKPIPKYPSIVGVITSSTGAAIEDIKRIITNRYPLCKIYLYPTLVQGEFSVDSICESIGLANKDQKADVIICGRGGGSIEDLWSFNEEKVAIAVFNSKIPIISAVGHESDTTIQDFVADATAPTPSGGALLAVPDSKELMKYLESMKSKFTKYLQNKYKLCKSRYDNVVNSYILSNPSRLYDKHLLKMNLLTDRLDSISVNNIINNKSKELTNLSCNLFSNYTNLLKSKINKLQLLNNTLLIINPLNLMDKGYSILYNENKKIINSVNDVSINDILQVNVKDGIIKASILEVRKDDSFE